MLRGDPRRGRARAPPCATALERILRGNTGALIVLGFDKTVESLCTGGFVLDVEFSATRLRELAKMDGAVVLDRDGTRILRADVHLVPDPSIPTEESGTRHRTAERVAKQTGYPVISVSQSMRIIALYVGGRRYVLEDSAAILSRANQALATLERYKLRLDEVTGTLSALEIEDLVTVRDVAAVAQRLEMVRRIAERDRGLRRRARHRRPAAVAAARRADRRRRARPRAGRRATTCPASTDGAHRTDAEVLADLDALSATDLLDLAAVARALGYSGGAEALDDAGQRRAATGCWPRCPRLPDAVVDRLVEHFGGLQKLLAASIDDLQAVEGVGETRARTVREGLSRLAESSILERYV